LAMDETVSLQNRRDLLKRQLAANEFTTLPDQIVAEISGLIQKISRNPKPLPFWYSALIIFFIILLTGSVASLILREFNPRPIIVTVLGIGLIYLGLILFNIHERHFNAHLQEHILDAIESSQDLVDLQYWLRLTANKKMTAIFSFVLAVLSDFFLWSAYRTSIGGFIGFGPMLAFVLSFVFYGAMIYYAILFYTLPNRLSRYHFKLYEPDPSSSALIHHLSNAFMHALYLFAFYAAITTVLTAMEGLLVSVNMVRLVGWWAILTTLFVVFQYCLSRITTAGKYKSLGEVQTRIEQLLSKMDPEDKEAREGINWLMDYHDRIKSAPNSALHFRAILEFVNSLILPLLAFVLAHLKEIVSLFR
jgi:hypothetical protein